MSNQELKKSIEATTALRKSLTSPKKALAYMVKAGIVSSSGKLTKQYKQGA